jgi:hypothetical protein
MSPPSASLWEIAIVHGFTCRAIGVLGGQGDKLSLIMKGGVIVKDVLGKAA